MQFGPQRAAVVGESVRPARSRVMIPSLVAVFVAGISLGSAWPARPGPVPSSTTPDADVLTGIAEPVRGRDHALGDPRSDATAHLQVPTGQASLLTTAGSALPPAKIARNAAAFTVYLHDADSYGAGIVLDGQGHIVTCAHVIEGLDTIEVTFADGVTVPATRVETDATLDLALLRVDTRRSPQLAAASITTVELGDELFTMGAPRRMAFSFNRGMASFVGRTFEGVRYLQSDLALNGGSSGGPVMNRYGQVVALSSFVLRDSEGIAFALPIDYAYERFARHLAGVPEGVAGDGFVHWRDAKAYPAAAPN